MKKVLFAAVAALLCVSIRAEIYTVSSPDGRLEVLVNDGGKRVSVGVKAGGKFVLSPFEIGLSTSMGNIGEDDKIESFSFERSERFDRDNFGIRSSVPQFYNQKKFKFSKNYWLVVRAYGDAVAYRFETRLGDLDMYVFDELLQLPADDSDWMIAHPLDGVRSSFESAYKTGKIEDLKKMNSAMLPFVYKHRGYFIALVESDLRNYPSMRITFPETSAEPRAAFSKYPKTFKEYRKYEWQADAVENYIAKTSGIRAFPWRAFVISETEKTLAVNDIVFRLADESKIADESWIAPGLSVWDWWNNWTLEGVGFKAGVNLQTYKYYVDYAARNGIPWVVIDTSWLNGAEIGRVSHEGCDEQFMRRELYLDVPQIIKYAHSKGVKVMPWILARTLTKYGAAAFDVFKEWGADGIKIDFIDRDDQIAISDMETMARLAAERKMAVDFHGCPPPAGLQRTYPNILNYEAVLGGEATKWRKEITPEHNINLAFVRMLAGSLDYTPGAMNNKNRDDYAPVYNFPQMQGTRAHMIAQFIVYFAPLQMMADYPTQYERAPRGSRFYNENSHGLGRLKGRCRRNREENRHCAPQGRHMVCGRNVRLGRRENFAQTFRLSVRRRILRRTYMRRRKRRQDCDGHTQNIPPRKGFGRY